MRFATVAVESSNPLTLGRTSSYILQGKTTMLVDAVSDEPDYLARVQEALGEGRALDRLVVTHAHRDHVAGARAVVERWPAVMPSKIPWVGEDESTGVSWEALRDKAFVEAGDGQLWVLHTPGHAPDHLCLFDVRSGQLWSGDLLINGSTVVIAASRGGSLRQYLDSLRRLLDLQPRRILPAHGDAIEHPVSLIRAYLSHRGLREKQILAALAAEPSTIPQLVERVYASEALAPSLLAAAAENVLAHLLMLEEDGRVARDESRWRLV
jgi:glyoxylase-like metal-dependent hydrolase (beta-lactamase superfamily II)